MILYDGVHLVSDSSLEELHAEAERIGLKEIWFQKPACGIPHYDVFGTPAKKLTVNCTRKELVRKAVRF